MVHGLTRYRERGKFCAMTESKPGTSHRYVVDAVDPSSGKTLEVLYPTHRLQWAKNMGVGAIKEVAESVRYVLTQPTAVYRGINRDADDDRGQTEGWLCYCGKPKIRYDYRSGDNIGTKGSVLLVFVNKELTFYMHRWEKEAPGVLGLPADADGRFKEKLI